MYALQGVVVNTRARTYLVYYAITRVYQSARQ